MLCNLWPVQKSRNFIKKLSKGICPWEHDSNKTEQPRRHGPDLYLQSQSGNGLLVDLSSSIKAMDDTGVVMTRINFSGVRHPWP